MLAKHRSIGAKAVMRIIETFLPGLVGHSSGKPCQRSRQGVWRMFPPIAIIGQREVPGAASLAPAPQPSPLEAFIQEEEMDNAAHAGMVPVTSYLNLPAFMVDTFVEGMNQMTTEAK
jgi:hypothetical protein